MKIKTSELTGRALDWAVATAEGGEGLWYDTVATWWVRLNGKDRALSTGWSDAQNYAPSVLWSQGGPIIDREEITIDYRDNETQARKWLSTGDNFVEVRANKMQGLIAAMRCYVSSKFGDEVDIPEELV